MSRLGKLPVLLPNGVQAKIEPNKITVSGSKCSLSVPFTDDVLVSLVDNQVVVSPATDSKRSRSLWGTVRANVKNLVIGVTEGFTRNLTVNGTGYRAQVNNGVLNLSLGYSHEIRYVVPQGIQVFAVQNPDKSTTITVSGAVKQQVGQVASQIRSLRKPEPYKGKGVRYSNEVVRLKEGKKK